MNNMNLVNQFMALVNGGGNPAVLARQMLTNNPKAKEVMAQFQNMANGRSPKELAMQLAKQNGVDVEQMMQFASRLGLS